MKKLFAILFSFWACAAQAQIVGTLPFQLQNNTTADATQVMADFNKILGDTNANGAKNGSNNDITSLNALAVPIAPTQGGSNVYIGTGSGTANVQLVATTVPTGFILTSGYTVNYIPSASNTSATTLSVAGTTAKAVLRQTSAGLQPLVGGEIIINQMATVIYDGTQYELINSAGASVPIGTIIDVTSATGAPTGYLLADGTLKSRATFAGLFSTISATGVAATTTSGNASVVVANSALYQTGWSAGGTNITCNSTISSIPDGTHIVLNNTAGSSGATTLTIGPYSQGDCSTTFAVPNLSGRTTAMRDTGGSVLTSATCTNPASQGSNCGAQTQLLTLAQLPTGITAGAVNAISVTSTTGSVDIGQLALGAGGGAGNFVSSTGTITSTGNNTISVTSNNTSGAAHPILPPVALVDKYIKI